ncbi:NB-ARC domain-containing protein [Lentzea xinjiangensis]|uniref:NB-ARC domain-containing protein n=1 Tax=Lentzea xinjiangensis TaxID=402600 RepID=A0A1H9V050_9PSEU|nr:helix-turn-helix domain-containing protein [Lentzea xinjiangensis]SES15115.1 NB-ARC domain-containing protein [Lentzea xinjiangensis]
MNSELFGPALRRLRERARLTQEQLAEKAGLSVNAVSALERGERRRPYPSTVRALAEALGLDDEELRRLQALVPRRDRQPGAPPVPVPRQLPAVPRHFTGRAGDLSRLTALLPPAAGAEDGTRPGAVAIAVIDGTAGVGKTTLAVAWAHQVRELFPDGQMYVNLHGYDLGPPVTADAVLDGFLRALGVPITELPPTVAERAALFRSLVDGRRVLMVLDNAGDAEQVRPLLPGSGSCMVLVTSRVNLAGLAVSAGAVRINLDRLPDAEATSLLRAVVGPDRARREPAAVAELVRLCARLPLALQVAGQRAVTRPHTGLADVAGELADEERRLHLLSTGTDEYTAVRPVFSWSYHALPAGGARLFRLLGLHVGPDIGVAAVAALADVGATEARRLLDGLTDTHLIEHTGRDRFAPHDLLRAYARERVEAEEPPAARRQALLRLTGFYLHTAAAADQLLHPGRHRALTGATPPPRHPGALTTFDEALVWCETERATLVAVIAAAAEAGLDTAAWQLANNLWSFYYLRKHWSDRITAHEIGLACARRSGDLNGQARMLNGLAGALADAGRFDDAIEHFHRARPLFRDSGDRWGEAAVLVNLANTCLGHRRHEEALGHAELALPLVEALDNPYLEGIALGTLSEAHLGLRRYDKARNNFLRVLELCRRIGHRHGEGTTLLHLGEACLGLRQYDDALDYLTQALDLSRNTADRHGEAHALMYLGNLYDHTHRPEVARSHWTAALSILDETGDPRADEVRECLRR